jgi:hypothetical protein
MEILSVSPINLTLTLNASDAKEAETATQVLTNMGVKWDLVKAETKDFVVDLRLTLSEINMICDVLDKSVIEVDDEMMKVKVESFKDFFLKLNQLTEAYQTTGAGG